MALLCLCLYRFVLKYFLFCYYPWTYIRNVQTSRSKNNDFFSIAAHVLRNLFWKSVPHIWANFNHLFKVFQTSFSPSSHSKKMRWRRGSSCAFPQNLTTRKLGEFLVFYAVLVYILKSKWFFFHLHYYWNWFL